MAFTGARTTEDAVRALLDMGVRLPVISSGAGNLVWATDGTMYRAPTFRVEEVDATGAGDALIAGLITYAIEDGHDEWLTNEASIIEALIRAQASGASAVTRLGCIDGVTRTAVETLVAEQGAAIRSRIVSRQL
jgi:fructokinase